MLIVFSHLVVSQEQPDKYFMRFDPNSITGPKVLDFQFGRILFRTALSIHSPARSKNEKTD